MESRATDRKTKPEWIPFGAGVRRLRKERGHTGTFVAKRIGLSPPMYSAIERGTRFCLREHAVKLDEVLETGDEVLRLWTKMTSPDRLPDWYYQVGELERAASEIRQFHPLVIPGLLQSEDYARALFRVTRPWVKQDAIERMVESRLKRHEVLEGENAPLLWFVLSDSVLRSPIGTDACMRTQLDRLAELVERETIRLQVLPGRSRRNPGREGGFRIYGFPDKPTIASAEHMLGEAVIDDPREIRHCEVAFGALQAAALPDAEALDEINKARSEFA